MLTPMRWATAAAALTFLPPSTIAASRGVLERKHSAIASNTSRTFARASLPAGEAPDSFGPREVGEVGTAVLFVAGTGKHVRFRVDLRDGTLSTPRTRKLLEGVVDVVVADRLLFLCQAGSDGRPSPRIIGFDLETAARLDDPDRKARAASINPTFCSRVVDSTRLQNI